MLNEERLKIKLVDKRARDFAEKKFGNKKKLEAILSTTCDF